MSQDNFQPHPDEAALDALLDQARWPEPSPQSTERLHTYWLSLHEEHSHRRIWPLVAATAAAVALIVAGSWFLIGPFDHHHTPSLVRRPDSVAIPLAVTQSMPSRPPTDLELAIYRRLTNVPHQKQLSPMTTSPAARPLFTLLAYLPAGPPRHPAAPPSPTLAIYAASSSTLPSNFYSTTARDRNLTINALVDHGPESSAAAVLNLLADSTTAAETSAALRRQSVKWTDLLFDALSDPRENVRLSAAAVLADIDGPVITRRLAGLTSGPARREAVAASFKSIPPTPGNL